MNKSMHKRITEKVEETLLTEVANEVPVTIGAYTISKVYLSPEQNVFINYREIEASNDYFLKLSWDANSIGTEAKRWIITQRAKNGDVIWRSGKHFELHSLLTDINLYLSV